MAITTIKKERRAYEKIQSARDNPITKCVRTDILFKSQKAREKTQNGQLYDPGPRDHGLRSPGGFRGTFRSRSVNSGN